MKASSVSYSFVLMSSDAASLRSVPRHSAAVCQLVPQSARNFSKAQSRVRTGGSFLTAQACARLYFCAEHTLEHAGSYPGINKSMVLAVTPPLFK